MAENDVYSTINKPQLPPNPTKFYTHFLYKAILVSIFLLVLPFFPSQAPDFINQTVNTRSWELLQLLFVGIAVSYGLFSRRNDETEKEQGYSTKFDSAQSYVAKLLQVSSVFDDESDNPSGSEDHSKVQTWNSQYYRGEPIVVVAKENSVLEKQSGGVGVGGGSQTVEKPLLLPVRSLKNGVSESAVKDSNSESRENFLGRSSSLRSNSRRFSSNSSKSRGGEYRGVSPEEREEKTEENVVYRSPIPWRSRSGRMEVKENSENSSPLSPPLFSLTPSMEDSPESKPLESRFFRSQSSKSPKPVSSAPSPPFSSEIQAKSNEELVRKKIYQKSSSISSIPPPPPPPPPPPHFLQRNPTVNSSFSHRNGNGYAGKELRRTARSFPAELSRNETEELQNRGRTGAEFTIRTQSDGGRSFRTMKRMELDEDLTDDKEIESFIERRGQKANKFVRETRNFVAKQTFNEYPNEGNKEFVDKIAMETDDDSEESEEEKEEDKDKFEELPSKNKEEMAMKDGGADMGPDVDKKADEFIAKFREQIRLQRIASIRRSTGQIPKTAVR